MEPMEPEQAPEGEPEAFQSMRRIEYIARIHHMAFSTILSKDGLPPAQVGAVKTMIRRPGMSQRELADELHIQRATVTIMLQKMERAGFVDRRPDPEDQRISRIYPTDAAIAMEEENKKAVDAYFQRCFQGISSDALRDLAETLTRIGGNLQAILNESANKE